MLDKLGNEIKIDSLVAFHAGGKNAELKVSRVTKMTDKQIICTEMQGNWERKWQRKPHQVIVIE